MNPMKQNAREAYEKPVVTDITPVTVAIVCGEGTPLPGSPDDPGYGDGF